MKKSFKIILGAIVGVMALIIVIFIMKRPYNIEYIRAEKQDVEMYFIETGEVVSDRIVDVFSVLSGQIINLNVAEGQQVNKGDVICTLDTTMYELQIGEIKNSMTGYEAQSNNLVTNENKEKDNLRTSKEDLNAQLMALEAQRETASISKDEQIALQIKMNRQYEDNLVFMQDNFNKIETLYESGVLSKKEYDDAKKSLDDAKLVVEQGEKQLEVIENTSEAGSDEYFDAMEESIKAQIKGIDDSLNKSYVKEMQQYYNAQVNASEYSIESLQKQISDGTVVAPISGKIENLFIKDTNVVSNQTAIAAIKSEKNDTIEVYVSTNDIDEVAINDKVELVLKRRDEDKISTGKIIEIDDKAVEKVSQLGVTEKKVKVSVIPDDYNLFKTGYDVDVKFIFYNDNARITIPKTAIFKHNDKDVVWLVENEKIKMQTIVKDKELRTDYVVKEGIDLGDIVIKNADDKKINENMKIQIKD